MITITDMPALCPAEGVCPNLECPASGRMGVHAHQERRYICRACKTTFAAPTASPLFGLKTPQWVVLIVLTLLAYGCPVPAIVADFGLDERAVATWLKKAGAHAKAVQEELVCSGQVDLGPGQGEERYVKHQAGTVWMAMAMRVCSRLWLWGAVSPQRTTAVITAVVQQVRAAARRGLPILWATDGVAAWASSILSVFRAPQPTGKPGRPPLVVWADLHIIQVIKQDTRRRVRAVRRTLSYGNQSAAEALGQATQVGGGCSLLPPSSACMAPSAPGSVR